MFSDKPSFDKMTKNVRTVLEPTWQFWDPDGVKLESLCNFSIVGCQWTVNCLLGMAWHICIAVLFPVNCSILLKKKNTKKNNNKKTAKQNEKKKEKERKEKKIDSLLKL